MEKKLIWVKVDDWKTVEKIFDSDDFFSLHKVYDLGLGNETIKQDNFLDDKSFWMIFSEEENWVDIVSEICIQFCTPAIIFYDNRYFVFNIFGNYIKLDNENNFDQVVLLARNFTKFNFSNISSIDLVSDYSFNQEVIENNQEKEKQENNNKEDTIEDEEEEEFISNQNDDVNSEEDEEIEINDEDSDYVEDEEIICDDNQNTFQDENELENINTNTLNDELIANSDDQIDFYNNENNFCEQNNSQIFNSQNLCSIFEKSHETNNTWKNEGSFENKQEHSYEDKSSQYENNSFQKIENKELGDDSLFQESSLEGDCDFEEESCKCNNVSNDNSFDLHKDSWNVSEEENSFMFDENQYDCCNDKIESDNRDFCSDLSLNQFCCDKKFDEQKTDDQNDLRTFESNFTYFNNNESNDKKEDVPIIEKNEFFNVNYDLNINNQYEDWLEKNNYKNIFDEKKHNHELKDHDCANSFNNISSLEFKLDDLEKLGNNSDFSNLEQNENFNDELDKSDLLIREIDIFLKDLRNERQKLELHQQKVKRIFSDIHLSRSIFKK